MRGFGIRFGFITLAFFVVASVFYWTFGRSTKLAENGTVFGESIEAPSQPSALVVSGEQRELGWITADGSLSWLPSMSGRMVISASRHDDGAVLVAMQEGSRTLLTLLENGKKRLLLSFGAPVAGLTFSDRKQFAAFATPLDDGTHDVFLLDTDTARTTRVKERARSFLWISDPVGLAVLDARGGLWLFTIGSNGNLDAPVLLQEQVASFGVSDSAFFFLRLQDAGSTLFRFNPRSRTTDAIAIVEATPGEEIRILVSPSALRFVLLVRNRDNQTGSLDVYEGTEFVSQVFLMPESAVWLDDATLIVEGQQNGTTGLFRFDTGRETLIPFSLPAEYHLVP